MSPLFSSLFSLSLHWPFFITPVASSVSLLQVPSPSVCGLFRSIVFLGVRVARWDVSLLFLFAPSCLLRLFVCLWSAVSSFSFLALCPGSSPFLPLFAWVPSVFSVGGGHSLPLFCVFLTVRLSCIVWGFSPPLSFAILPFPPRGASLFPSLVRYFSLPDISSVVHCLFPLGPFGFCATSFVCGLFLWTLLHLSFVCPLFRLVSPLGFSFPYSFLVPLLVFSPLDDVGAFVYALSQVILFLVSRHCLSGWYPSGGVLRCFFLCCCYLPYLHSGFLYDACVLFHSASLFFAYAPWQLCRCSSGVTFVVSCPCFVSFSCSSCYYFSLSLFAFVSPHSLSRTFSEGALSFIAFSPLMRLPLPLLLLLGVLRLLLLPLLPFRLIVCGVLRLNGFFRIMLFSLLSLRLLLGLLLSSLHFTLCLYGSPLPVFSFRACCV